MWVVRRTPGKPDYQLYLFFGDMFMFRYVLVGEGFAPSRALAVPGMRAPRSCAELDPHGGEHSNFPPSSGQGVIAQLGTRCRHVVVAKYTCRRPDHPNGF